MPVKQFPVRVTLTAEGKQALEMMATRLGTPQSELLSRLVEHYASQTLSVQMQILGVLQPGQRIVDERGHEAK